MTASPRRAGRARRYIGRSDGAGRYQSTRLGPGLSVGGEDDKRYTSISIRAGSCTHSLMRFRNVTDSRPSMMRWS